jgi:hypothetical protein
MIEQGRKRRVATLLVTGLAVAAVTGIAIAGTAMAHSKQSSGNTAAAGTPSPAGVSTPTPSPAQTPNPSSSASTPSPVAKPQPAKTTPSPAVTPKPTVTPTTHRAPTPTGLPADPVAACKTWLKDVSAQPGSSAKVVARLNGAPGTVLILADSNYWAGCDTAYARNGGTGSSRQPTKIANPAPADAEAFTVANNLILVNKRQYQYYWAAGQLPAGVVRIFYTFPDGQTTSAVIQGNYWLMQHQSTIPFKPGMGQGPEIKVALLNANGQTLRTFLLVWGQDTCAQISHGC